MRGVGLEELGAEGSGGWAKGEEGDGVAGVKGGAEVAEVVVEVPGRRVSCNAEGGRLPLQGPERAGGAWEYQWKLRVG